MAADGVYRGRIRDISLPWASRWKRERRRRRNSPRRRGRRRARVPDQRQAWALLCSEKRASSCNAFGAGEDTEDRLAKEEDFPTRPEDHFCIIITPRDRFHHRLDPRASSLCASQIKVSTSRRMREGVPCCSTTSFCSSANRVTIAPRCLIAAT